MENIPVPLTHGVITTTWEAIEKQFLMFCGRQTDTEMPLETHWAERQIIEMFSERKIYSQELPINEWEMNLSASCGFGYNDQYPDKRTFYILNLPEQMDYLDKFYIIDCIPLPKVFGKTEYLPFEKIDEENQRCIESYQVVTTGAQVHIHQYFNKQLAKHGNDPDFPLKLGVIFSDGGFDRLMRNLEGFVCGMGDVKKWDKHFLARLRRFCKRIRMSLYRGINPETYRKKLEWDYRWAQHAYVLLPWGQVVCLYSGMLSGHVNTSYDNSIAHLLITLAYVKHHEKEIGYKINTFRDALSVMKFYLYADDHLFRVNLKYSFLSTFARRAEFYRRFGFTLKPEDDKVLDRPHGLTFLGGEVRHVLGHYVPAYNISRIWSSTVYQSPESPNMKEIDYFNKAKSLLLLLCGHGSEIYNYYRTTVLRKIVSCFDLNQPGWRHQAQMDDFRIDGTPDIPTYKWAWAFWTGSESKHRPLANSCVSPQNRSVDKSPPLHEL